MTSRPTGSPVWPALPDAVHGLATAIGAAGGRLLVVGGWVRDALRGTASKDFDLEVHGLAAARLDRLLVDRGFTPPVGRQFAVWRHTGLDIDVALPRGTAPAGGDHAGIPIETSLAHAVRHRDLTVNALAWDPLSARLLDVCGGRADLEAGRLRAVDLARFGEDPLRVLRVARLAPALRAEIDADLLAHCRTLDLAAVAIERLARELERMLLELDAPWAAIDALDRLGQLAVFPPLAALKGVPQDPEWHPEGDVFVHTGRVVDVAAALARAEALEGFQRDVLLWSALCHDLGKPATTFRDEAGRIRSPGHDLESANAAEAWLTALRLGTRTIRAVRVLVRDHLAPVLLPKQGAGLRAYRRLARRLDAGAQTPIDLERLARADQLGRTTEAARAGRFEAGPVFLAEARRASVDRGVVPDVVRAASAMRRGVEAGPGLGRFLARCREIQDETGWEDESQILERVWREGVGRGAEAD